MSKKRTSKDVVTICGSVWNDKIRTVAGAVNYNAQILKNALDRIDELERQLACMSLSEKGKEENG